MGSMLSSDFAHAAAIFGLTFVLEDVAVLGAALLVVNSMVSLSWAAGSSFAGIWFGDIGLYLLALRLGRPVLDKPWFRRLMGKVELGRSESWFRHHGAAAILLSRAIPGTRLPTYLAAGLLKVPATRFLTFTAGACVVWVAALFWISYHVGMMAIAGFEMFRSEAAKVAACVVLAIMLMWPLRKLFRRIPVQRLVLRLARLRHWEFWPPAIFYIPVALKCLLLALRYRSFGLPTIANPGMTTGGLIGESKYQTLAELERANSSFVAETHLIPFRPMDDQWLRFDRLRREVNLEYPVVLKPDVGQRGLGFRIIHSDGEARSYLESFRQDTLLQRYAPGPHEAGILYYRFPGEGRGRIFAITDKFFPSIAGDGEHTIEELIRADGRAGAIAETYLTRFEDQRERVLAAGQSLKLVEAGNHCQGAIFLEGGRLWSQHLEDRIDTISQSIPGFFFGRYDVRYSSEDALRRGEDFLIIELNGVSSEATNIYDPSNSLTAAYRMLFRQWEIVFAIADANRKRGLRPTSLSEVVQHWRRYRQQCALHPVSD
jgi:membrane protein DedA with SNARE-associated domain